MKRTAVFWLVAFVITVVSAAYQRRTGPTYPIRGKATLSSREISYQLDRSFVTSADCPVRIETGDPAISGTVEWKRHGVDEAFVRLPMRFRDGVLTAELPHQPPAGKLDYRVVLESESRRVTLPASGVAIIRFKGDVPLWILVPHILAMFAAMLLSTRTGLEYFNPVPKLKLLTYWTLGFLAVGGMILGPLMQKYAFGAFWTGWPYGVDLTDNKTAFALLGWFCAAVAQRKSTRPQVWTVLAAVVLLAVYMIPHSVLGSELDYSKMGTQAP